MQETYTFNRDGVPEAVTREDWRWEAVYSDGTTLKQFDESSFIFHQFKEIDQDELDIFKMVHDKHPSFTLVFPIGAKLVHFYRKIGLDYMSSANFKEVKLYCFGYELGNQKVCMTITPDNELIVSDDFDKLTVQ